MFNNGRTPIPVDVYTLVFTSGSYYYTGTYEDVVSIWDPNAGLRPAAARSYSTATAPRSASASQ
jgi:hypothetical protein